MSGREHEPIAAFFPSIDRNLMRDLDRHLRNAAPMPVELSRQDSAVAPAPVPEALTEQPLAAEAARRPNTADILDAVEQAASSMSSMTDRIHQLEARETDLERMNEQLKGKLAELLQLHQTSEAALRTEQERADQAEMIAAQHLSRAQELESDLETALGDLTRVAEAITGTLGGSGLYRRG